MENTCRLCLSLTDDNVIDATTRVILSTLSLKVDFSMNNTEPKICTMCASTLQKCFDLFNLCSVTKASVPPLYPNERKLNKGDPKSCLFCTKTITTEVGNTMRELEKEIATLDDPLANCILYLYASASEEPVLCEFCHDSLLTYVEFFNNCREVECKIQTLGLDQIDIKQEFLVLPEDVESNVEALCDNSNTIKDEAFCDLQHNDFMEYQMKTEINLHIDIKLDDAETESNVSNEYPPLPPPKQPAYKCSVCPFVTTMPRYLKKHTIHWHSENPLTFKCDICPFTTRHKQYLSTHAISHKEDVEVLKCDSCEYQTKKACNMRRHLKNHDETIQYRCEQCPYVTKHKVCLKRHEIVHKSPSEIPMYKCEFCSYETRYKKNIKVHVVTHKDATDVPVYKCDSCEYTCKVKSSLQLHKLVHKKMSEVKVLKCEFCSYTTKRRGNLNQHSIMHKKGSERKTFKCDLCGYEAKWKTNLKQHMGTHKDR